MQRPWNRSFAMPPVVRSRINGRDRNEDSFLAQRLVVGDGGETLLLMALADGMGGYAHGDEIGQEALRKSCLTVFRMLCVDRAINALTQSAPASIADVGQILVSALDQTREHVCRMVRNNSWGKAGSTIVMATVLHDTCLVVNLGDSPMFHFESSTGKLRQITEDHTVAGVLLRAGRISPELARYHAGRTILEFYLGANRMPREAPLHEIKLADGDVLLLCSDGVTGQLPHEAIVQCLAASEGDLDQAADALISASTDAGETDNQTLLLWRYKGNGWPLSAATQVLSGSDTVAFGVGRASHEDESPMRSSAVQPDVAALDQSAPDAGSDAADPQPAVAVTPPDRESSIPITPAPASGAPTDSTQAEPSVQTIEPRGIEHVAPTAKHDVSEELSP